MNYFSISAGVIAIGYSIYTVFIRKNNPEKFKKLEPMKKFWGEKLGIVIHFIGYTVTPLIVGIIFIHKGINGLSIF
ncbi:MAG: hypothetical protein OEZ22_10420 [Spirochaetia bacterium]|nr:hypothetical protein [Spirochaetia bacterium]